MAESGGDLEVGSPFHRGCAALWREQNSHLHLSDTQNSCPARKEVLPLSAVSLFLPALLGSEVGWVFFPSLPLRFLTLTPWE